VATQTTKQVIRRGAFDDAAAVSQQVAEGIIYGEVGVNPGNLAAGAEAETIVALPAGTGVVGDLVFVQPPNDGTLEAGLVPLGARINAVDSLAIKLRNVSGGAIDGAQRAWTYCILRTPRVRVG
jgi:hypothetical protein